MFFCENRRLCCSKFFPEVNQKTGRHANDAKVSEAGRGIKYTESQVKLFKKSMAWSFS